MEHADRKDRVAADEYEYDWPKVLVQPGRRTYAGLFRLETQIDWRRFSVLFSHHLFLLSKDDSVMYDIY
jgi:hypothetical protein